MTKLTEDERDSHARCIAAGFAAAAAGIPASFNPFFTECRTQSTFNWTEADAANLRRADAWWFGWHEMDDARSTARRRREP